MTASVTQILGADAVSGEPSVVRAVATHLRTVSANVDTVRTQLLDQSAPGWSGGAADAFRGALDEVPGELDKLSRSYDAAATTISGYAGSLDALRSRSDALAARIAEAQGRRDDQAAAKTGAQREVAHAAQAHASAADPAAHAATRTGLDQATASLATANARLAATTGEIEVLRRQAHDNRVEFEDAVRTCCDGLHAAGELGIRNSLLTWYDRNVTHGSPIGRIFDGLVVSPFRETAHALAELVANPSLDTLSDLLGGIGDVLALVGCVLLIAALGFGTGGLAFAAGGMLIAGSRVVAGARLGTDVVRGAAGRPGSGEDVVDDAIAIAVPGKLGKAASAAAGGRGEIVDAGKRLARQQGLYELSGSPQSKGWVTRRLNEVRPLVLGEGVHWTAGAGLDLLPPASWVTDPVKVTGATCSAPAPLFSPSVLIRHQILAPAL